MGDLGSEDDEFLGLVWPFVGIVGIGPSGIPVESSDSG